MSLLKVVTNAKWENNPTISDKYELITWPAVFISTHYSKLYIASILKVYLHNLYAIIQQIIQCKKNK